MLIYPLKTSVAFYETATHNEPYTSICIISTKLVVHSTLAYERCYSHVLEKGLISVNLFENKINSKSPSTWSSFMFFFPIWTKKVVSQFKWNSLIFRLAMFSIYRCFIFLTRFILTYPSIMEHGHSLNNYLFSQTTGTT